MKIIHKELLQTFYPAKVSSDDVVTTTYIDKNPLIRWLYWNRLKRMIDIGKKHGGNKILDLGCGQGVFIPSLSESFEFVYGLDINISVL